MYYVLLSAVDVFNKPRKQVLELGLCFDVNIPRNPIWNSHKEHLVTKKNSEHWGVCGSDKMSLSQSIEISFYRFCAPFAFWQAKYPSLRANIRISSIMIFSFQRQRPINKLDAPNIFTLVDIQLNWCPINTPINSNGDSVPWQLIPCLINRICKTIGSNRSY